MFAFILASNIVQYLFVTVKIFGIYFHIHSTRLFFENIQIFVHTLFQTFAHSCTAPKNELFTLFLDIKPFFSINNWKHHFKWQMTLLERYDKDIYLPGFGVVTFFWFGHNIVPISCKASLQISFWFIYWVHWFILPLPLLIVCHHSVWMVGAKANCHKIDFIWFIPFFSDIFFFF